MQRKRQILIPKNRIFLIILILPYFKPASLEFISPNLDEIFNICRIFSFIFSVSIYLYNRNYSKMLICLTLYQLVLLISTILNNGDYWRLAVSCGTIISFSMLTEVVLKQNPQIFFNSIAFLYFILIPLDLILYLIYPGGFGRSSYYNANIYYFLSIRNGFAPLFIPIIVCLCIYSAFKNKKITCMTWITILCGSLRLLMTWSATGVVSWFILIMYIIFLYRKFIGRFIDILKYYFVFLTFQICFVFLRIQEHFSYIIEVMLHRSLTFTGRTEIWDYAYLLIKQSPVLGYGVYEGHGLIPRGNLYYYSHNGILEVLLQGGFIGLIIFFMLFIIAAIPLYKHRTHYIVGIISTGIFSLLVIMLAEATITDIQLYMLLVIGSCSPYIIKQLEFEIMHQKTEGTHRKKSKVGAAYVPDK